MEVEKKDRECKLLEIWVLWYKQLTLLKTITLNLQCTRETALHHLTKPLIWLKGIRQLNLHLVRFKAERWEIQCMSSGLKKMKWVLRGIGKKILISFLKNSFLILNLNKGTYQSITNLKFFNMILPLQSTGKKVTKHTITPKWKW